MPSRNRIKTYIENGYYHIYNRGVEKRTIFLDEQDYRVFLHLLKTYLSPQPAEPFLDEDGPWSKVRPLRINLHREIKLLAFVLLPNHFHLLLRQQTKDAMTRLMRALSTSYVVYFNRKYERVGPLFQDRYKAAWVGEGDRGDSYLLHLSRYIHLNPKFELQGSDPFSWPYSSYPYYLGKKTAEWVDPQPILNYFAQMEKSSLDAARIGYHRFVESVTEDPREPVKHLLIE